MLHKNRSIVKSVGFLMAILGGLTAAPVLGKSKAQAYYFKNIGHSVYLSVDGDKLQGTEKKSSYSEWILVPAKKALVYIQNKKLIIPFI